MPSRRWWPTAQTELLFRILRDRGEEVEDSKVSPKHLAELLTLIDDGTISQATAKQVLEDVAGSGTSPRQIVGDRGLVQISDTSEVEQLVAQALAANPQAVADYHAASSCRHGFLTAAVMKVTRGKVNPAVVNEILRRQLGAL